MEGSSQKLGVPPPQAIHHELRTAENSAGFVLSKLQLMKLHNPHITLLDVGAGSGTISVAFAKDIPHGHVTGIDVNPEILPRAQAIAEMTGVKNIDFQQGDAYKLPFADETFDVTYCHQMLTHLKAPWDAISEMIRVTKAGGIVAAREGDLGTQFVWPELPGLLKFNKFITDVINASGGTSTGGRQLLSWVLKAGVKRDHITVSYSTWSHSILDERKIWAQGMVDAIRGGRFRTGGLKLGLTTENELEEMAESWKEWAERDDASLAMIHGEVLIKK